MESRGETVADETYAPSFFGSPLRLEAVSTDVEATTDELRSVFVVLRLTHSFRPSSKIIVFARRRNYYNNKNMLNPKRGVTWPLGKFIFRTLEIFFP